MKTCTVTFYYARNYGTFLQAWALQRFLGESNTLLYFNPSDVDYRFYVKNSRWRKLPFFWRFIALYRYIFKRRKVFDEVNMLRHTRKYYSRKELIKEPPEADVYIAGSDQIWNTKANFENYFLDFGSPNAKRIAYAASMGGKEWSAAFTQKVLPYLKKFHAISVREESSVPFLNSIGLEKIAVTCDPAILWTVEVYRSHFPQIGNENNYSKYIFVYYLRKEVSISMRQFLNEKNIVELILGKHNKYISVAEWLHTIDMADAVITNSFHGTVFSIIFHKPFIFLLAHNDRDERLFNLLRKIKLEYRLLGGNETKEEIGEILYRSIDWEQVDRVLEEWRTYSANWLKSALEN